MANDSRVEQLSREELIALVLELHRQMAVLLEENARLKRSGRRQAAPFSKEKPVPNPKKAGRKKAQGPFGRRTAPAGDAKTKVDAEPPPCCPFCGGPLEEDGVEFATTTDVPEQPQPEVTQYRVAVCHCRDCGKKVRGTAPGLAADQYGATAHRVGPSVMAAAHALSYGVGVPQRKVPGVLKELTGVSITQSAIAQDALRRAEREVGAEYEQLRQAVRQAPFVHTDDTGWRVGGKTAFLMGFETDRAAVCQIRPQHRNEEVREIIPSDYAGVMITDRGKSYDAGEFDAVEQQKRLGHILRNITEVLETKQGRAREFGVYAKLLLQEGMELWPARDSKPSKRSWRDIAASSRSPKDGWPMGTKRYRTLYAMLLWLYPRPFRERFAEGTAQTFHDLCQEHQGATRSLFGLALWVFCETLFGIIRENTMQMSQLGRTILRVALGALAVWMVPLVASQFVEDWHWGVGGFVRVYVVLFLTGIVMALVASRMGVWSYKAGVGLALAAGLALGWSTMVQVADSESPANLVYYGVLVMGAIGAWLSRLKPRALANTLFAMAATLALIAILLTSGAPPDMARRMAIGHGVFAAMFAASGFLFRHASVAKVN